MTRIYRIMFVMIIVIMMAVLGCVLLSCTRYTYTITPAKISTVNNRVHIQPTGKAVPVGDTTVMGWLISKRVEKHNRRMRQ